MPLLECIRDGARAVEDGKLDFLDGDDAFDGTNGLKEQHEASFAAACTACRALRDLSALSKDFAAVVTDDILVVNARWSTCVVEGAGYECSSGGLISGEILVWVGEGRWNRFFRRQAPIKNDHGCLGPHDRWMDGWMDERCSPISFVVAHFPPFCYLLCAVSRCGTKQTC